MIPKDPVMLLSYINTQLRDHYASLDALCADCDIDQEDLIRKLDTIDYQYDKDKNQFI